MESEPTLPLEPTLPPTRFVRGCALLSNFCLIVFFGGILLSLILVQAVGNENASSLEWLFFLVGTAFLGGPIFSLLQVLSALRTRNRRWLRPGCWKLGLTVLILAVTLMPPLICGSARHYAESMQNSNNLKNIGLAFLNYADAHGQLPPHRTGSEPDENGIYPHSWRVYLLPFLEQQALFEKIRLNEPWNSEWNRQFHDQMPSIFSNPECSLPPGQTTYCVVMGEGALFPENGDGPLPADVGDPPSETVLTVESAPGCWMDPAHDLPLADALSGTPKLTPSARTSASDSAAASASDSPCGLRSWAHRKVPLRNVGRQRLGLQTGRADTRKKT